MTQDLCQHLRKQWHICQLLNHGQGHQSVRLDFWFWVSCLSPEMDWDPPRKRLPKGPQSHRAKKWPDLSAYWEADFCEGAQFPKKGLRKASPPQRGQERPGERPREAEACDAFHEGRGHVRGRGHGLTSLQNHGSGSFARVF